MEAVEQDATKQFLLGLIDNVKSDSERGEIEYMSERIFPVLVPAIIHLLDAMLETRKREHEGDHSALPIKPIDHLARYLVRHNPKHAKPTAVTVEMQDVAQRILRK